jgi:hypothetical protein
MNEIKWCLGQQFFSLRTTNNKWYPQSNLLLAQWLLEEHWSTLPAHFPCIGLVDTTSSPSSRRSGRHYHHWVSEFVTQYWFSMYQIAGTTGYACTGGCELDSLSLSARETMYMLVPLAISPEMKKTQRP